MIMVMMLEMMIMMMVKTGFGFLNLLLSNLSDLPSCVAHSAFV